MTLPALNPLHIIQGSTLNSFCDKIGLPDAIGDLLGTALDIVNLNPQGALNNLIDLTSGRPTQQPQQSPENHFPGFGTVIRQSTSRPNFEPIRETYFQPQELARPSNSQQLDPFKGWFGIAGTALGGFMRSLSFLKPILLKNDQILAKGRLYDSLQSYQTDRVDGCIDGCFTPNSASLQSTRIQDYLNECGSGGTCSDMLEKAFAPILGSSQNELSQAMNQLNSNSNDPMALLRVQQAMQKRTEMINLLTNLMKMEHEARMSVIRNLS